MDEQIIKYFLGMLTENERMELLQERERNPGLKKMFADYQNTQALLSSSHCETDDKTGRKELDSVKRRKKQRKIRRLIYATAGYAASVCLIVMATWFVASPPADTGKMPKKMLVGQQELYVPAGQRVRITLSDGTTVWLNSGSTLLYPSAFGKERKVTLAGEAYFDVAENEERPFIVVTENVCIKALGTRFNVYGYPGAPGQNTILLNGSVKIYKPDAEQDGIILTPNQQLFYENGTFRLENFADKDVLLWKDGIYSFKNEKLDAIIHKLELYFDVDFIIKSPSLPQKEYTGKFRQKDGIMEILRIIQKIHPFKIERNENLNQITLS
jgi:ferric-dicitrate binding protein FerR (iron transport regulator)